MISRALLCWVIVGTVCGLFAGLYWNVLEMTHALQGFEGSSLLIVMPLAGFGHWPYNSFPWKSR